MLRSKSVLDRLYLLDSCLTAFKWLRQYSKLGYLKSSAQDSIIGGDDRIGSLSAGNFGMIPYFVRSIKVVEG